MLTENDSQISDCYYVVTMRLAQAHFKSVYKSVFFLCDAVPPLANSLQVQTQKRASFELQQFLEQEKQKAMLNELVAKLTEVCWDKCVTAAPGTKFSGSESSCLTPLRSLPSPFHEHAPLPRLIPAPLLSLLPSFHPPFRHPLSLPPSLPHSPSYFPPPFPTSRT
ncbi:unnamed protein product [Closterium sp. Naga37s-1]|nr:unnamed protein product [Closterium sp. Naga37s-1]